MPFKMSRNKIEPWMMRRRMEFIDLNSPLIMASFIFNTSGVTNIKGTKLYKTNVYVSKFKNLINV